MFVQFALYEVKLPYGITGSVVDAGEDPPTCKMGVVFYVPDQTEPSFNNLLRKNSAIFHFKKFLKHFCSF